MNMGAQVGGAVATSLTPFLASRFGWHTSFFVAAGLAVVGALSWLLVDPTRSLALEARIPEPTLQQN
jgi:MFS transporter, ACS family, glucarate transporter